jgi:hypothetical protein
MNNLERVKRSVNKIRNLTSKQAGEYEPLRLRGPG